MCGRDEEKNETEVLLVRQSSSEGCGIPGAWTKKGSVIRLSKNPKQKKNEIKGEGKEVKIKIK